MDESLIIGEFVVVIYMLGEMVFVGIMVVVGEILVCVLVIGSYSWVGKIVSLIN